MHARRDFGRFLADMRILALLSALVLGSFVVACGGSTASSSAAPTGVAASAGSSGGLSYTTAKFGIPLSVVVAPGLGSAPTDDTPGLLSWTATVVDNNRIRFLIPAEVYPPDATTPMPPPADFLGYVQGLAGKGAIYSDTTTTTVDGAPVTLLTAKTSRSLDGSLGCPTIGAEQGEGCFGLQPEYALRMAIMEVGGKPLLAWARSDANIPDTAFLKSFEDMLKTVDFK